MWRDATLRVQQGLTFASKTGAVTIKKLLDANGQSFETANEVLLRAKRKVPPVGAVIQEHIDLLVRPSSGTLRTYQTILGLHINPV